MPLPSRSHVMYTLVSCGLVKRDLKSQYKIQSLFFFKERNSNPITSGICNIRKLFLWPGWGASVPCFGDLITKDDTVQILRAAPLTIILAKRKDNVL